MNVKMMRAFFLVNVLVNLIISYNTCFSSDLAKDGLGDPASPSRQRKHTAGALKRTRSGDAVLGDSDDGSSDSVVAFSPSRGGGASGSPQQRVAKKVTVPSGGSAGSSSGDAVAGPVDVDLLQPPAPVSVKKPTTIVGFFGTSPQRRKEAAKLADGSIPAPLLKKGSRGSGSRVVGPHKGPALVVPLAPIESEFVKQMKSHGFTLLLGGAKETLRNTSGVTCYKSDSGNTVFRKGDAFKTVFKNVSGGWAVSYRYGMDSGVSFSNFADPEQAINFASTF